MVDSRELPPLNYPRNPDPPSMSSSPVHHSDTDLKESMPRLLGGDELSAETAMPPDQDGNMTRPFTQLTQQIPVKDMEAWVHRTTETRRAEIRDRKVPRPPNAFILYRSAYAGVAQKWHSQGNQMIISCILAQRWRQEPDGVKAKYQRLARIEQENHQKAFPDYKFVVRRRQDRDRDEHTKQQKGGRRDRRSVFRTTDQGNKRPEHFSVPADLKPSLEDSSFPESVFATSSVILAWLQKKIPPLRDHIPSDLTIKEYRSYLSSTRASSARRILTGLVLRHYSWAICGLVILCPFLTSPDALDIEEREDDLLTLICDLHVAHITHRSYAVMCRRLGLSHLDLPDNIRAIFMSQVSSMEHKPTNLSFTHLRFVAARFIASKIGCANDQKLAQFTWNALQAMLFQDLEVSKSCVVLLQAYRLSQLCTSPS